MNEGMDGWPWLMIRYKRLWEFPATKARQSKCKCKRRKCLFCSSGESEVGKNSDENDMPTIDDLHVLAREPDFSVETVPIF